MTLKNCLCKSTLDTKFIENYISMLSNNEIDLMVETMEAEYIKFDDSERMKIECKLNDIIVESDRHIYIPIIFTIALYILNLLIPIYRTIRQDDDIFGKIMRNLPLLIIFILLIIFAIYIFKAIKNYRVCKVYLNVIEIIKKQKEKQDNEKIKQERDKEFIKRDLIINNILEDNKSIKKFLGM